MNLGIISSQITSPPKTAIPTIVKQILLGRFRVTNNDGSSAEIFTGVTPYLSVAQNDVPPTSRGTIISGASTGNITSGISAGQYFYTRAKTAEKEISDPAIFYYDGIW